MLGRKSPLLLAILLTALPFIQGRSRAQLSSSSGGLSGVRSKTFSMPDSVVRPLLRGTMETLGLKVVDDPEEWLIEAVGSPDFVIARVPARMVPTLTLSVPVLRTIRYYLKADITRLSVSDTRVYLTLFTMQGKELVEVENVDNFAPKLYRRFWDKGARDLDLGKPEEPETVDYLPVIPLSPADTEKFEEATGAEIDPSVVATANWRIQLEKGTVQERETAATALGLSGSFEAEEPLVKALKDPVLRVRAAAAHALGLLGSPGRIPDLIGLLPDKNPLMRATAARSLGMIGNKRGLVPLQNRLAVEKDQRVLAAVKESIDRIKNPKFLLESP